MPIDLAVLAATLVTSFLVPYVKLGAHKIAEALADKVGEAATQEVTGLTNKIWNRVKSVFSSEGEQFTLLQLNENPDAARPLVESLLKKKLQADPQLAEEFEQLIQTPIAGGSSTGAQIMSAHIAGIVDARGANFSGAQGVNLTGVSIGDPRGLTPITPGAETPKK
ncbi:MAG TPA: hypothetical protein VE977_05165 [Pyrinomonadaceae bacterium]|nr:hypothetical protein [Pyrinomonadaceae bacterium]